MSVLWIDIPPHTVWGWVLEVAVGLGILWAIGFAVVVLVDWFLTPPRSQAERRRTAEQEQHEAQRAARAIEELYRLAEAEVKRRAR